MSKPQFMLYPTYQEFISLFDKNGNRLRGTMEIYKQYLGVLRGMEQMLIMKKCWSIKKVKDNTILVNLKANDMLFNTDMAQKLGDSDRRKIKEKLVKILVNKLKENN